MRGLACQRRDVVARGPPRRAAAALVLAVACALGAAAARADVGTVAGAEARRFAAAHPVWRVSGDPDWRPYSFRGPDGRAAGLDVELARLLGERLGVRLEWVEVGSWAEAVRRFRAGEIDLVMGTARTPEREAEMLFTAPYAASPVAVIARLDSPFLVTLRDLAGQTVAAPEGHVTTDYLLRLRSGPRVVVYPDLDASVRAVAAGHADAVVAGLIPAATSVSVLGLENLKVAGLVDARFDLRVGVRRDWPLARELLDQAIAADPPEVRVERFDRWLAPIMGLQRQAWRWRTLFLVGLVLAAALAAGVAGVGLWNRVLRERVQRATAAIRAEMLARAESETRFRTMFEEAPIGMYRSTPAGSFLSVNPFLARMFEFDSPRQMVETVNRTGIAETLFEDPRVRRRIVAATTGGGTVVSQVTYRTPGGRRLQALLSMTAMADPVNGERTLLGFVQDVTDRVREEATRQQREKLLALGQLAGGVAHDFKNLLSVVQVGVQLLVEERGGDPVVADAARHILDAVAGASALSERLLRFVHARGAERPGPLDVRAAVHGAAELFDTGAGHQVPVVEDLGEAATPVVGFQADLQTALLNLFLNARDAMPDGGTLAVRTRDVTLEADACAALAPYRVAPGRYLAIEVSDTGAGMPPDVLARCRDPFFTTKGEGGTGLGLWMVHCVVSGHGGALALASHAGAGTTATIYLPAAAAPAASAAG